MSDQVPISRVFEPNEEVLQARRAIEPGDKLPGGIVVAVILGQSQTLTVYTTEDNQLRWKYHANGGRMPGEKLKIVSRFDTLMAEIKIGVPEKFRRNAYEQLGKALFSAVDSADVDGMESHFYYVAHFIKSKALPPARLAYIAGSTAAGAVVLAIMAVLAQFTTPTDHPDFLLVTGGIGGSIGAFISVLQRSTTIDVDYNWEARYIVVQGAVRILLGMLFGMFAVIACDANLVMGFANESLTSLLVLAVVAGISERFVPEIIKRLEAQAVKEPGSKT